MRPPPAPHKHKHNQTGPDLRGKCGSNAGAEDLDQGAQARGRAHKLQRRGLQQRAVARCRLPYLKVLA